MHAIIIVVFIFANALTFYSCTTSNGNKESQVGFKPRTSFVVDSICQRFIDNGKTQGLSLALAKNGDVIFAKGFGMANIESRKPATENTIYPLGSVSKFITAVLTLNLVEKGKIQLSDKVTQYFTDIPNQKGLDEVTIEHLLRHTSGLVDHEHWADSIYINHRRLFTQEEFFKFIDQPLLFRPGSEFAYSNAGYGLLSNIIERVENKSFHIIIKEALGSEFDIQSLGLWPEQWSDPNATMGYEIIDGSIDTSFHMMTAMMKGDGGLSASVLDLIAIISGLLNQSILSKESLDLMLTPTMLNTFSIDYGLGTRLGKYNGLEIFGHSGGYSGTGWAMLAHYPEPGITFAAAMNTSFSPDDMWSLRSKIMPVVFEFATPTWDTGPIDNVDIYTGTYQRIDRFGSSSTSSRIAFDKDQRLYWDNPLTDTPGAQLFPLGSHMFNWKSYPYDVFKFHLVDNEVVACSEYYDGFFVNVRMKSN